jgi:N-acyl-phosphatidylethanolamine-hydrolysing phospholipase D
MGRFDERAVRLPSPLELLRWRTSRALWRRPPAAGWAPPTEAADTKVVASGRAQLTWLGHASFSFSLGGLRFLVDPVLGPRVGPVPRLAAPGIAAHDLPPVDVVLVTHNHRDHMDLDTLARVPGRPRFVVPLGNAAVLAPIARGRIDELDWWDELDLSVGERRGPVTVRLVPASHWSMRVPWDRNEALWGGFVVKGPEGTLYHSGDTGHFEGFREIGERAGPIDWALLPIGAYEPRPFLRAQHMGPDEAVEAAVALRTRTMVAMHWGTFRLTAEHPAEPPELARVAHRDAVSAGRTASDLWVLPIGATRLLG